MDLFHCTSVGKGDENIKDFMISQILQYCKIVHISLFSIVLSVLRLSTIIFWNFGLTKLNMDLKEPIWSKPQMLKIFYGGSWERCIMHFFNEFGLEHQFTTWYGLVKWGLILTFLPFNLQHFNSCQHEMAIS